MKDNTSSLKIGLLENSCHSLERGYELWSEWEKKENAWLLKESIIWVHHGIELILKQILVKTNAFLIFSDVDKEIEKLGKLQFNDMSTEEQIMELFDKDDSVLSVAFNKLIKRASIALSIPELNIKNPLRINIDKLTKYRNKIIHFSIEIDANEVAQLLSDILDPLLNMLERELKNDNTIKDFIPKLRKIGNPVKKFRDTILGEILDNAKKNTINALPPKGNGKAGIVYQIAGSGLLSSLVSYIKEVMKLSQFRKTPIIVLTDRILLQEQFRDYLSEHAKTLEISHLENSEELASVLNKEEAHVILISIQKIRNFSIKISKEVLFIGYNLHSIYDNLINNFPNSVCILFCTQPLHNDSKTLQLFGPLIGEYTLRMGIKAGSHLRFQVKICKISDIQNISYSETIIKTIANNIVENFELNLNKLTKGKAIIVVPSLIVLDLLYSEIIQMRPNWCGNVDIISKMSTNVDRQQMHYTLERFKSIDEAPFLIISTGTFLVGLDISIINTCYITCQVSEQLKSTILTNVSRFYPGKVPGLVLDYYDNEWT
jgi:hypothetical protein